MILRVKIPNCISDNNNKKKKNKTKEFACRKCIFRQQCDNILTFKFTLLTL